MVTTWKSNLKVFIPEMEYDIKQVREGVAVECFESIVFGSASTGAPGQPDDLREGQWSVADDGPDSTLISTADPSARSVEDGISHKFGGPITLKSPIGGFHSVKLTHQNAERLVEPVVLKVVGNIG